VFYLMLKPASQQASKPASQQASKPASQQASKPTATHVSAQVSRRENLSAVVCSSFAFSVKAG